MLIDALDLGVEMGFAEGEPGAVPYSAQVRLKRDGEPARVAFGNLIEYLVARFTRRLPALVVREAYLPLAALLRGGRTGSEDSVYVPRGMAAIVEGVCQRFGVPCESVADATWRKHFTGTARAGDREASKRLSIEQCWRVGYLPRACFQGDRAEACGIWDWAATTLARTPPRVLTMFPPQREKKPKRRRTG